MSLESAWPRVERNIDFAISYGALFELNAAAFRKGWDVSYPGEDVLQVKSYCFHFAQFGADTATGVLTKSRRTPPVFLPLETAYIIKERSAVSVR